MQQYTDQHSCSSITEECRLISNLVSLFLYDELFTWIWTVFLWILLHFHAWTAAVIVGRRQVSVCWTLNRLIFACCCWIMGGGERAETERRCLEQSLDGNLLRSPLPPSCSQNACGVLLNGCLGNRWNTQRVILPVSCHTSQGAEGKTKLKQLVLIIVHSCHPESDLIKHHLTPHTWGLGPHLSVYYHIIIPLSVYTLRTFFQFLVMIILKHYLLSKHMLPNGPQTFHLIHQG